ncbi:hypothetical protein COLO4_21831 [Corchorus olitorius]|uniref:Myb/SANT-like domain-containing protein n=1 Tax=Corchorus olitorius TaxID=93759 RepID=A0A1R3IQH2_9ROSI|nr:hypothetical protein COLO4_21831 [Corchorus olitorius]
MAAKKSRRWFPDEDAALITAMVDMCNVGRFNVDSGFKGGYLLELERMFHESLPQANIKAKPHIESRIRTLKKEWGIIYDMINGTNTSGFGWDDHRKMLTAEDKVWDDFVATLGSSQGCPIQNAQTAANILEEMAQETEGEAADQDAEMESNNVVQDDAGDGIREAGKDLSRSIGSEMVIQEKVQELDIILAEIVGLTEEERDITLSKIPDHPEQMLVFGSLPPHRKLAWVRRFLSSH